MKASTNKKLIVVLFVFGVVALFLLSVAGIVIGSIDLAGNQDITKAICFVVFGGIVFITITAIGNLYLLAGFQEEIAKLDAKK